MGDAGIPSRPRWAAAFGKGRLRPAAPPAAAFLAAATMAAVAAACSAEDPARPDDGASSGRGSELQNAFLNLAFADATALTGAPSGPPRLYVAERSGIIHQFDNDLQVEGTFTFLDLGERIDTAAGGLLDLAFHPRWPADDRLFVRYMATAPTRVVVASYRRSSADPDVLDPESERIALEILVDDPSRAGTGLAFGRAGMLLIPVGDGGDSASAQDPGTLTGSLLRIDIDADPATYAVPPDNPLVGRGAGAREEAWAWGLRAPTSVRVDPASGTVWVTDRGPARWDEVNVVAPGDNLGWPVMDGAACHTPPAGCDTSGLVTPVFTFGSGGAPRRVLGVGVYRGSRNPELMGRYLLADGPSGQVWAVDAVEAGGVGQRLVDGPPGFSGAGTDPAGEPVLANASDGRIYRFVYTSS